MNLEIEEITPHCTYFWDFEGSIEELIHLLTIYKKLDYCEIHLGDQRITLEKQIKKEKNED